MRKLIGLALVLLAASLPPAPGLAQTDVSRPGTVAHAGAGTGFPEQIGRFRRAHVLQYDDGGLDLSANYDLETGGGWIRLSVYIYPAPRVTEADQGQTCRMIFDQVTGEILRNEDGVRAIESGTAPAAPGVDPALGLYAAHDMTLRMRQGPQPLRTETYLYCYVGRDWLVKFRISATPGLNLRPEVESFIRNGPWPGRAMPGAVAPRAVAPENVT